MTPPAPSEEKPYTAVSQVFDRQIGSGWEMVFYCRNREEGKTIYEAVNAYATNQATINSLREMIKTLNGTLLHAVNRNHNFKPDSCAGCYQARRLLTTTKGEKPWDICLFG